MPDNSAQVATEALITARTAQASIEAHLKDCLEERRLATAQREALRIEFRNSMSGIHRRLNTGLFMLLSVCFSGLGYFVIKTIENIP